MPAGLQWSTWALTRARGRTLVLGASLAAAGVTLTSRRPPRQLPRFLGPFRGGGQSHPPMGALVLDAVFLALRRPRAWERGHVCAQAGYAAVVALLMAGAAGGVRVIGRSLRQGRTRELGPDPRRARRPRAAEGRARGPEGSIRSRCASSSCRRTACSQLLRKPIRARGDRHPDEERHAHGARAEPRGRLDLA